MTTPAGQPAEEERIQSLDERFSAIETEQGRQSGMLDRILAAVGGTSGQAVSTAHQADRTAVDDRLDRPSRVQEEMLQAIKDVKAGLAAGTTAPAAPEPERAPAEVTVRGKQRLQKRLFGADPA